MTTKHSKSFFYRLHSRHDEITVHISRAEAHRLIAKLSKQLCHKSARGHREYFLIHIHGARVYHKLTVTHHAAHHRQIVARLDRAISERKWATE